MPKKRAVFLMPGSLSIVSCMRPAAGGNLCVNGEGMLEDCTSSCRYAAIPDSTGIVARCSYSISGRVVNHETGRPLASKIVSLILPTRKRYRTSTAPNGSFNIFVPPDHEDEGGSRSPTVALFFGDMPTTADSGEIALFAEFTDSFRRTYPDVRIVHPLVSRFSGEVIDV